MKEIISPAGAPAAIGPYSQAVRANGFLFVSGQLPLDPSTGAIVEGGIEAQSRQSLSNIKSIVQAAGLQLADVVKTTVFLADIEDFVAMNGVYAEFFTEDFPARAAVQVACLPRNALVEIEAVAHGE
ncbi:MAG: RidA family protein [Oscillospiraceae bacterium]|nr:RidA family protein [Oscillospiraceae bacterium]